jgi:hypothetical protein
MAIPISPPAWINILTEGNASRAVQMLILRGRTMFEPAEKRPFDSNDSPLPVGHGREASGVVLLLGLICTAGLMAVVAFGVDWLVKLAAFRVLR